MLRFVSAPLLAPSRAQLARSISHTAALLYPRAPRAIEMKYVDGTCTLSVPLPLSGFDEERVFSIPPETTVADVVAQIGAEDRTVQNVELRSKRGRPFKPQDTLQQILKDDFELVINDRILPVTAPVFTGNAYVSLMDDGELDVRSVAQKSAVIDLRHTLESSTQWKISYAEFVQMCRDRGIPKKQAPEVLKAFHQAGVLFYFSKADHNEDLQQSIFLQPRNVLDGYLESLGLTPVTTQRFTQEREKLLRKIQSLEPEHVALKNLEKELHNVATRHANGIAYSLTTGLVGTFGLYFWLSFIHFSWDIMEPVTYFTGFGMSVVGYTWWSVTNQEYEYENIYDYFYKKKLGKLKKHAQFDQQRFEQVARRLADTNQRLVDVEKVLKKSTTIQANYVHLLQNDDDDDDDDVLHGSDRDASKATQPSNH